MGVQTRDPIHRAHESCTKTALGMVGGLAGRDVRRMLREGKVPPSEFTRPEVAETLISAARKNR